MVRLRTSPAVSSNRKHRLSAWLGATGAIALSFPLITFALDAFTYHQAEQAYKDANCEQAIAGYNTLLEGWRPYDWQDYEARSQSRASECTAYQTLLPALDAAPTEALLAANQFLNRFPNSALIYPIRQQIASRLKEMAPDVLANVQFCDTLPSTLAHRLLPRRNQNLPALRYACGQTYQAEGRYTDAIEQLQHFLKDYPKHEQTSAVEVALATAMIDEAKANKAGELPSPTVSGLAATGTTKVQIRNDSPEPMRIIFSGAETRFEELPACEDCQAFTTEIPKSCPEKGPTATYTLKPGEYQVLVRSVGDRQVTPFTGEWTLSDGYQHSSCFYIVRGTAPVVEQ